MRKIEALNDFEHLLLRPNMYVGSVNILEDKLIIYDSTTNLLSYKNKSYSEGFYRILDEVIDNAFDEAKRCLIEKYPFKDITISINSKTNEVEVTDAGRGFINGDQINEKTGITNIETALTRLRAGSNFQNENFDVNTIGMNGIGVSATNMLSDYFKITTVNETLYFEKEWNKFVSESHITATKKANQKTYTKINFIPRKDVFKKCLWDYEIILTKFLLRQFQLKSNPEYSSINLRFLWDGKEVDLNQEFIPKDSLYINLNKNAKLILWRSVESNNAKISFVNSSQCTGFHQTYFDEFVNQNIFGKEGANQFYRTLLILNLKPKYVQFKEQNKTRFDTNRFQMESILPLKITKIELNKIKETSLFKSIMADIKEFEESHVLKKIKSKQKKSTVLISDKFYSSKQNKNLFITEGMSALGSINQKRNPTTDSLYALRGKIKNVQTLNDLSQSKLILELMSIMGLKLDDKGASCKYEKIVIATDADCLDGNLKILTKDGDKQLKNINYDDMILSSDGNYHKVNNIVKTKKDKYYKFIINGKEVKCSENHKFMVRKNNKIIEKLAKDIRYNDEFILKDGEYISFKNIEIINRTKIFYDIEVDETHDFFININNKYLLSHNCDGHHIAGLLIQFFYKWFPKIIKDNKLFILNVPLLSYEDNGKTLYKYKLSDMEELKDVKNVRYLKGLGSLSIKDWDIIFKDMNLTKMSDDSTAEKFLKLAFSEEAGMRKKWLEK